jgi:hypothetical protein
MITSKGWQRERKEKKIFFFYFINKIELITTLIYYLLNITYKLKNISFCYIYILIILSQVVKKKIFFLCYIIALLISIINK